MQRICTFIFFVVLLTVEVSKADVNNGPLMCARLFDLSPSITLTIGKDFVQKHPRKASDKAFFAENVYDTQWVNLEIPHWLSALESRRQHLLDGFEKMISIAESRSDMRVVIIPNGNGEMILEGVSDGFNFQIFSSKFIPVQIDTLISRLQRAQKDKQLSLRLFLAYGKLVSRILQETELQSEVVTTDLSDPRALPKLGLILGKYHAESANRVMRAFNYAINTPTPSLVGNNSLLVMPTMRYMTDIDAEDLSHIGIVPDIVSEHPTLPTVH